MVKKNIDKRSRKKKMKRRMKKKMLMITVKKGKAE